MPTGGFGAAFRCRGYWILSGEAGLAVCRLFVLVCCFTVVFRAAARLTFSCFAKKK
jgi:hypothetical protein